MEEKLARLVPSRFRIKSRADEVTNRVNEVTSRADEVSRAGEVMSCANVSCMIAFLASGLIKEKTDH